MPSKLRKAGRAINSVICLKRKRTTLGDLANVLTLISGQDVLLPAGKFYNSISVNVKNMTVSDIAKKFGLTMSVAPSRRSKKKTPRRASA